MKPIRWTKALPGLHPLNGLPQPFPPAGLPGLRYLKRSCCAVLLLLPYLASSQPAARFDPLRDTLAVWVEGAWKLAVPPATLMLSARTASPEMGAIHEVKIGKIGRDHYLIFKGKKHDNPALGFFVAVRLKETMPGRLLADNVVQTCTGAPCNACSFAGGGCACDSYYDPNRPLDTGSCNHTISSRLALAPVEAKE